MQYSEEVSIPVIVSVAKDTFSAFNEWRGYHANFNDLPSSFYLVVETIRHSIAAAQRGCAAIEKAGDILTDVLGQQHTQVLAIVHLGEVLSNITDALGTATNARTQFSIAQFQIHAHKQAVADNTSYPSKNADCTLDTLHKLHKCATALNQWWHQTETATGSKIKRIRAEVNALSSRPEDHSSLRLRNVHERLKSIRDSYELYYSEFGSLVGANESGIQAEIYGTQWFEAPESRCTTTTGHPSARSEPKEEINYWTDERYSYSTIPQTPCNDSLYCGDKIETNCCSGCIIM